MLPVGVWELRPEGVAGLSSVQFFGVVGFKFKFNLKSGPLISRMIL